MTDERLFKLEQAAEYLHLDERIIRKLVEDAIIPGIKIGDAWRFRRCYLDAELAKDWSTLPGGDDNTDIANVGVPLTQCPLCGSPIENAAPNADVRCGFCHAPLTLSVGASGHVIASVASSDARNVQCPICGNPFEVPFPEETTRCAFCHSPLEISLGVAGYSVAQVPFHLADDNLFDVWLGSLKREKRLERSAKEGSDTEKQYPSQQKLAESRLLADLIAQSESSRNAPYVQAAKLEARIDELETKLDELSWRVDEMEAYFG
jgi:excisionase family DNA binding protein